MRAGILGVLLFVACAAPGPASHIVMFEGDGSPVDPSRTAWSGGYVPLDEDAASGEPDSYDGYLDALLENLEKHVEKTGSKRVVIYIHGGLNTRAKTVKRALDLSCTILNDTGSSSQSGDPAYPIFINWRSSLVNSYGTHLLWTRQGGSLFDPDNDYVDNAWDSIQFLFAPLVLAADIVRGVLRFPMVAVHQLEEATEWLGLGRSPERETADTAADVFVRRHLLGEDPLQVEAHTVKSGRDAYEILEEVGGFLRWVLFLPVKVVTTMIVDIGGTGSWSMMERRVALLFEPEIANDAERYERAEYGLRRFLARLAQKQLELELEVDLVGHSMGTIVVTRILLETQLEGEVRRDGEQQIQHFVPRFDDIVFLGAACSVADYQASVFPYLHRNGDSRMHHVTLHPDNEIGEAPLYDLAPRGSLLTWIDDFLARPLTPQDRTAGRSTNLLPALANTPIDLRERISVRVLPWAVEGLPQEHGDFNELSENWAFWRELNWRPDPSASRMRGFGAEGGAAGVSSD